MKKVKEGFIENWFYFMLPNIFLILYFVAQYFFNNLVKVFVYWFNQI
ncbi:hypothetical protein ACS2CR_26525 [Bacillus cereus group sp. BceL291]